MTNTIMNIKSSFFVGKPTLNCDFNTGNKNEMDEAQELLSILLANEFYTEIEFNENTNNNK